MRLFEEIGGNVQERDKAEENKKSTLRAFASRANKRFKNLNTDMIPF